MLTSLDATAVLLSTADPLCPNSAGLQEVWKVHVSEGLRDAFTSNPTRLKAMRWALAGLSVLLLQGVLVRCLGHPES